MSVWCCPSCALPLEASDRVLRCEKGHTFDVAKEGYVNLLLAQQKSSKQPGDNKAMVNARRMFLQQGYYEPLSRKIAELAGKYCANKPSVNVFDAGCGEGYYLNAIAMHLAELNLSLALSGIDISKFAVQKAAKQYPNGHFAVASTYHLPMAPETQDFVLQVFAPSSELEIARVLTTAGYWLTVNPGPNHLTELKQALYDQPAQHKAIEHVPEGFSLQEQVSLSFKVILETAQMRQALLMMTPFYWSASQDKQTQLLETLSSVNADFDLRVYVKASR